MTELEIRPYRPGDETAILTTFNTVFREVCGEGYVDRDLDTWRWEFEANPQGHRIILAVTPDGRVAAQYAAVPMAAHTPLGESSFVHAVDSMVHPDFRQGLKKPGLFVETGRAWFNHIRQLGIESMGFGYPVRPAWRIGSRFLGYTLVRVLDYLVAPLGDLNLAGSGGPGIEVEERADFPAAETDTLWARWVADARCAVVRDSRYLNWRYAANPGVDYRVLLARREGALVGWAVVHPAHELVPDSATFADWLLLPGEEGAGRALVARAAALAADRERQNLLAVLAPWTATTAFLTGMGFAPRPSKEWLERRLGSYPWHPDLTSTWLADHWYYTLGDSDLV